MGLNRLLCSLLLVTLLVPALPAPAPVSSAEATLPGTGLELARQLPLTRPNAPLALPDFSQTTKAVTLDSGLLWPGDLLTYTIAYTNSGTSPGFSVVVSDTLPAELDYVTGGTFADGTVVWNLGTVPAAPDAGCCGVLTFTAQVRPDVAPGVRITNTAVIDASLVDPVWTPPVVVTTTYPQLMVSKSVDPTEPVLPGAVLTYTLDIRNTGNYTVEDVLVMDDILYESGFAFVPPVRGSSVRVNDNISAVDQGVPAIASVGNTVYAAWTDERNGNYDVYFARSSDGGQTWSANARLNDDTGATIQFGPSIAAVGDAVYAAWHDTRNGDYDIYFSRSLDGGQTWSTNARLDDDSGTAFQYSPSIVAVGNIVYAVWVDRRSGNDDIYFSRSLDGGQTWSTSERVNDSTGTTQQWDPAIAVAGNAVYAVWEDYDNGYYDIYFARSLDGGQTWNTDVRLNDDSGTAGQYDPAIATVGDALYAVWWDQRNGNADIYFSRSLDGGQTWSANTRLNDDASTASQTRPAIATVGDAAYAVWADYRNGNADIYFSRSLDGGQTWSTNARLDDDSGTASQHSPAIALGEDVVYAVWNDNRNGNDDIFAGYLMYEHRWSAAFLTPGAETAFSFSVPLRTDLSDGAVVTNTATARSSNTEVMTSNIVTTTVRRPTLSLYKNVTPLGAVFPGTVLTYTLRYTNSAPVPANQAVMVDRLPGGVNSRAGALAWSANARLNDDTGTAYQSSPAIAVNRDAVYAVWADTRNGAYDIYFARSLDGGQTWSANTRLNDDTGTQYYPDIAATGDGVYAVWQQFRSDTNDYDIYFARSLDGGQTWNANARLNDDAGTAEQFMPTIAAVGDALYAVWWDQRNGNDDIYFAHSLDGGQTWSTNARLNDDTGTATQNGPAITAVGDAVYAVWQDTRNGNYDIYFARSPDGGQTWSANTQLNDDASTAGQHSPAIAAVGNTVYAVWADERNGSYDIYFAYSLDDGQTWSANARLDDDPGTAIQNSPAIAVDELGIYAVWADDRNSTYNYGIYFARSTDGGQTWCANVPMNDDTNTVWHSEPAIAAGDTVYAVWRDSRNGNDDIYFTRLLGRSLDLGTLPAYSTGVLSFTAQIAAPLANGTPLVNWAEISADYAATAASNAVTNTISAPDFSGMTLTATPNGPISPGTTLTLTVAYTNSGAAPSQNSYLLTPLSPHVTYLSGGNYLTASHAVSLPLGSINVGQSSSAAYAMRVHWPLDDGLQLSHGATLYDDLAPAVSSNPVIHTVVSTPDFATASLDVKPSGAVAPGDLLTYTLHYTNTGDMHATGVVISDTLPAGTAYHTGGAFQNGVVTWAIGAVPVNTGGAVNFTVEALDTHSPLRNQAFIASDQTAPVATDIVTTPLLSPVLLVHKTADPVDVVMNGELLTYTFFYTNTGTLLVENAYLVDAIPENTAYYSGGGITSTHTVTLSLGTVAAGAGGQRTFVVRTSPDLLAFTPITNSAWVFYDPVYPLGPLNLEPLDITGNSAYYPLGGSGGSHYYAQSFIATAPRLAEVGVYLHGQTSPYPDLRLHLWGDIDGVPDPNQVLASGPVILGSTLSPTGTRIFLPPLYLPPLTVGQTYWIVVDGSIDRSSAGSAGVHYSDANPYPNGVFRFSSDAGGTTWLTPDPNLDLNVRLVYAPPPASNVVTTTITFAPALEVHKHVWPEGDIVPGTVLTYTLMFINTGNDLITSVIISDVLPANTIYLAGGTYLSGQGLVRFEPGNLAIGASGAVSFAVRVNAPLSDGMVITNQAEIISNQTAPVFSNVVQNTVVAPILQVSKQVQPAGPVAPGTVLTYTLTYTNASSVSATGVVLSDTLPANTTYLTGGTYLPAEGIVSFALGDLIAGAGGVLSFTLQVLMPLPNGTLINNQAVIASDQTSPAASNAVTNMVISAPDFSASTKSVIPAEIVAPSRMLTYTITVRNTGNENATGVVVSDTLPAHTTYVTGGTYDPAHNRVTWAVGELAVGVVREMTCTVQVTADTPLGSIITNTADVVSEQITTQSIGPIQTLVGQPDLEIHKQVQPTGQVAPGTVLTYTLAYTNVGNSPVTGVSLIDTIPLQTVLSELDVRRLNDDTGTTKHDQPAITAFDNIVYAVWHDERDDDPDVYFSRSQDGGQIWSDNIRLNDDTGTMDWTYPAIAAAGQMVHAVWVDNRNGDHDIYYSWSLNEGQTWSVNTRLNDDIGTVTQYDPAIATVGDTVYAVWMDNRNGKYDFDIYYGLSADGGQTWSANARLNDDTGTAYQYYPAIAAVGDVVYVVWMDNRNGNWEIYYTRSVNEGRTWSTNARLNDDIGTANQYDPAIATVGDTVYAVWRDYRNGNFDIYYTRSADGGQTWSANVRLNDDAGTAYQSTPAIAAVGDTVYAVWQDDRNGISDIYYTRSADRGQTWSANARLNDDAGTAYQGAPAIAASSDVVCAVWRDYRDGNWNIYGVPLDSNSDRVHWSLGTISPAESGTLSFSVIVDVPVSNGTLITNQAEIASDLTLSILSNIVTNTVRSAPDFSTSTISATPADVVAPGALLTYTITARNTGNENATGVVVTDTLPVHTTYVSGGTYNSDTQTVSWDVGDLLVSTETTRTFTARVNIETSEGALISNTATIYCDQGTSRQTSQVVNIVLIQPRVTAVGPARNAMNVAPTASITATFNKPMNTGLLITQTVLAYGAQTGRLPAAVTYDTVARTMTLSPFAALKPGEVIWADITENVLDTDGNPVEPAVWQFTTAVSRGWTVVRPAVTYGVGNLPSAAATGDIDRDGDLDLVTANSSANTVSVLRNQDDGTFATHVTYNVDSFPQAVILADMDGDGDLDLGVVNLTANTLSVLRNNGNGTFAVQVTYSTGSSPLALAAGDLDGDGDLDLVIANYGNNTLSVLHNQGNGVFDTCVNYNVGSQPRSVAIGDFDGDGQLDLAVANYGDNTLSVLHNQGNGTFAAHVAYPVGSGPWAVMAADFNGDGASDVVALNQSDGTLSLLLNNGDGDFAAHITYSAGASPRAFASGDLNGNGALDLVVANYNDNNISVLYNQGEGTFAPRVNYNVGSQPYGAVIGDLNGDGAVDIATANSGSNNVSVLLNGPTPPAVPVLAAINNPQSRDSYLVSWGNVTGAISYTLQEYIYATFNDPIVRYTGPATQYMITGQPCGNWYYRVQAIGQYGTVSAWSNVQSVLVKSSIYLPLTLRDYIAPFEGPWEREPNDTWQQANGPLVSGRTYYGTFPSGADTRDYFSVYLRTPQSVELWLTNIGAGHNYDLILRNAALSEVGYSGNLDNANEHIRTPILPTGWYYIQVYNRGGTGSTQPYHLRVVHPAAALTAAESELTAPTPQPPLPTPIPPSP